MGIEFHEDGSATVDLAGLPTSCGRCLRTMAPGEATRVFSRFAEPIPAEGPFPMQEGVMIEVCQACLPELGDSYEVQADGS